MPQKGKILGFADDDEQRNAKKNVYNASEI